MDKTNALRIVAERGVAHTAHPYAADGPIDGVATAQKIGMPVEQVFKTLVAQGKSGAHYVFVVPVAQELDLKQAARLAGDKSVEMIAVKDLLKVTGYVRGGCSPVGMRKLFPTWIDESAILLDEMYVSAGRVGLQMALAPEDLAGLVGANFAAIVAI